ncbi:hypothetical protein [Metabacillus arenae]|uniref:Uncharacterized protein n=1 Tax=Metabacillus arenae TaxID=2771434 RepID=A0A926NE12_9BACI|nr:hypothetical protein [Metabacillus arenae]MBD1379110.1 hypothetical protein [Metabacillus arenae]
MEKEQIIRTLESLLSDLESAYYGGFRATTNEEEHRAIREAIKLIK